MSLTRFASLPSPLVRVKVSGSAVRLTASVLLPGCLGIHVARLELRLAAARFFRAFPNARMSNVEGMSDADMEPEMIEFIEPKGHRCLVECN